LDEIFNQEGDWEGDYLASVGRNTSKTRNYKVKRGTRQPICVSEGKVDGPRESMKSEKKGSSVRIDSTRPIKKPQTCFVLGLKTTTLMKGPPKGPRAANRWGMGGWKPQRF